MISINRADVDAKSKIPDSKRLLGKDDAQLYPIYVHSQTNLCDMTKEYSIYEMAHWTNYAYRFCNSRLSSVGNSRNYVRGSIIFVDLGAGNFGHEPSYTHPAVVLMENKYHVFIAPCSSKKYGQGIRTVIDATSADGFSGNTGIQTDSIRWISKDRIISSLGKVSNRILDELDNKMLSGIPTYKNKCRDYEKQIKTLEEDKDKIEQEREKVSEENKKLSKEIEEMKAEIDKLRNELSK